LPAEQSASSTSGADVEGFLERAEAWKASAKARAKAGTEAADARAAMEAFLERAESAEARAEAAEAKAEAAEAKAAREAERANALKKLGEDGLAGARAAELRLREEMSELKRGLCSAVAEPQEAVQKEQDMDGEYLKLIKRLDDVEEGYKRKLADAEARAVPSLEVRMMQQQLLEAEEEKQALLQRAQDLEAKVADADAKLRAVEAKAAQLARVLACSRATEEARGQAPLPEATSPSRLGCSGPEVAVAVVAPEKVAAAATVAPAEMREAVPAAVPALSFPGAVSEAPLSSRAPLTPAGSMGSESSWRPSIMGGEEWERLTARKPFQSRSGKQMSREELRVLQQRLLAAEARAGLEQRDKEREMQVLRMSSQPPLASFSGSRLPSPLIPRATAPGSPCAVSVVRRPGSPEASTLIPVRQHSAYSGCDAHAALFQR